MRNISQRRELHPASQPRVIMTLYLSSFSQSGAHSSGCSSGQWRRWCTRFLAPDLVGHTVILLCWQTRPVQQESPAKASGKRAFLPDVSGVFKGKTNFSSSYIQRLRTKATQPASHLPITADTWKSSVTVTLLEYSFSTDSIDRQY